MALQKGIFSLNLGNGIDQKTDNKIGPDNSFAVIRDFIYKKIGKLYKRFGTDRFTNAITTSFPNPLSISQTLIPSSLATYKDQLLLQNKGALYSWQDRNSTWQFKSHHYPVEVETSTKIASELQYGAPSAKIIGNIRVLLYQADDLVTLTSFLKYTVIDNVTGNYLIDDVTIATSGSSVTFGSYARIMSFASNHYVVYQQDGNLKAQLINLTNGTLSAAVTLVSDAKIPTGINAYTDNQWPFEFIYTTNAFATERNLLVYYTTTNQVKIVAVKNDATLDAGFTPYVSAVSLVRGFAFGISPSTNVIYLLYQNATFQVVHSHFSFTASALTLLGSGNLIQLKRQVISFDIVPNPFALAQMFVMFDEYDNNLYSKGFFKIQGTEPTIYRAVLQSGILTAASVYCVGYQIAARSVSDTLRNTIYGFIQNTFGDQQTYFMIDILKGKTENAPFVQAKWDYSAAIERKSAFLPQTSVASNKIYFGLQKRIDDVGNPVATPITFLSPQLFKKIGIEETFINLAPSATSSNVFLADAIHTSGGYLGYYDGSTFSESSYFLMPELMDSTTYPKVVGNRIDYIILQTGTPGQQQITQFIFKNGIAQLKGPTFYFTISFTAGGLKVWYEIDGQGTAPPGSVLKVAINSSDTSYQVAKKTYEAFLTVISLFPFEISLSGNNIIIIDTNNGVVVPPDISFYSLSASPLVSGLNAGEYQYAALWTYYDVNGQIVYSAPSIPISVNALSGDIATIVVYAPNLTNRNVASIKVQLYRTTANGVLFYKVTDLQQDISWNVANNFLKFTDTKSDANLLNSPEFLYTNGGILENYQIPNVKYLCVFKNRIITAGVDDPTAIYYSKTAAKGVALEFAEENFIQIDIDSDAITGLSQLDDKLIIFKNKKVFFLSGDGVNDLGEASSFSLPIEIASDVGCISHKSIVQTPLGLMFKSDKGIYLLSRGLQLNYIGKEVEDFNGIDVVSAKLLPQDNQIRFILKSDVCLVYDYLFNRWTVFSQYAGDDCDTWKDKFARVDASGFVYVENKTIWKDVGSVTASYAPNIKTKWLQVKDIQDFSRIYRLAILGDLKSNHTLNYKIYYDYDETNYDEYNFDSSVITGAGYADNVYQPIVHLKRQKTDAMMIELSVIADGGSEECLELVDMSLVVGLKQGLQKVKADKKL